MYIDKGLQFLSRIISIFSIPKTRGLYKDLFLLRVCKVIVGKIFLAIGKGSPGFRLGRVPRQRAGFFKARALNLK